MADLTERVEAHLVAARADERGRSAELLVHDGPLRQTIIALTAGTEIGEHNVPDAASIHVLHGRVRVPEDGELEAGSLWAMRGLRTAVVAVDDAAFLLTAVTGVGQHGDPERAR
ncbi:cupin [Georgenia deserti]|uniref:Cupin n=1 Tax=Georgenia deserti TaxID=2093781 RepID=A0ABW4L5A4_9MICO